MTDPLVEKVALAIHWANMDESMAKAWRPETFKATKGELEAAQAAIAAVYEWQDISTAPKDGTEVLVWRPLEAPDWLAHAGVDKWSGSSWFRSRRYQQPTHWMPLPEAPSGEGE